MNFDTVKRVIVETLGCEADQVVLEAKLFEDLGADSLAAVEMVMALEEATGIEIGDDVAAQMKTVADIMTYLEANK